MRTSSWSRQKAVSRLPGWDLVGRRKRGEIHWPGFRATRAKAPQKG